MYKYEHIALQIEKKIINHEYHQGERLPSIHHLADEYHCSKETIIKCYRTLADKHLIYVKKQSGFFVADGLIKSNPQQEDYCLHTGNPIVSMTSLIDAKHCMSIAIEQYSQSSLNMSLQGVDSLRELLPSYLSQMAIYTEQENIYLIQGITQMLSFLSLSEFPNHHKTILIEEPTYSYYIDFLKSNHIPTLTISRSEHGIDLKELEYIFQNHDIKFFYVVPRNHNPLGTTLNSQTRKKIAQLAIQYNVYIVEDDYFSHCSSSPRYLPIYYYQNGQNCIYLTSYSKTIPYIRIGICAIHNDFRETFNRIIQQSYFYSYQLPSLISQATFESYIRSSLYEKQSIMLKKNLKQKSNIIKKINKQWNHDIAYIIGGESGYYCTLIVNPDIDLDDLEKALLHHHIKIARNERCYYNLKHFLPSLRLSLSRIQVKELNDALKILYQIICQLISP